MATRQPLAAHRVAKPQSSLGICGSAREVLRHPFHEPQRLPETAAVTARDVELKGMHDLVAQHAIRLGHRRRKRHDDAAARGFGDAADRVGQHARDDVGLRELRLTAIDDQRLTAFELVMQDARDP